MAKQIIGRSRRIPTIDLSALFGRFSVPGSNFTLRFASTLANPNTRGHRELLTELKPMRDRVDAASLGDLTALLQRDLNDRRVARELIPYLLGQGRQADASVGFFPAVLAVLIPRGYLQHSQDPADRPSYPPREDGDEPGTYSYTNDGAAEYAWKVEQYAVEDEIQPLGLLKINPRECEIVVLDGQHRSNAFRYLSGDFDPSDAIYSEFYRDIPRPDHFDADLPVTVVWFEAAGEAVVEPRLISRQLFVDVNNSATAVSRARTILLDDRSVSSIATQQFYNRAAGRGFASDRFSLLHAAFDMDSDLADAALPLFALTSPEIVETGFLWLMLSAGTHSSLQSWHVSRMRAPRQRNQFIEVLGTGDGVLFGTEDDDNAVHVSGPESAAAYRQLMDERVVPVLWTLMEELPLLAPHYRAAAAAEASVSGDVPSVRDTWAKVFVGGEGLYWTFSDRQRVDARNTYAAAISHIEKRLREERARELGCDAATADQVFRSFSTKAFQVGFVMAAYFLAERGRADGSVVAAASLLMNRLASFTVANWVAFFKDVRPLVLKGDASPRMWPSYRNLLIRMYDQSGREFFDPEGLPESHALEHQLKRAAARRRDDADDMPDRTETRRIVAIERDKVAEAFRRAGLEREWFTSDACLDWGFDEFRRRFEELA